MHLRRNVGLLLPLPLLLLGVAALPAGAHEEPPALELSTAADRSAPVPLDGASVSGRAYVFVGADEDLRSVAFRLDDPSAARAARHTEHTAPLDLAGTATNGTALPLDTGGLTLGTHRVTATLTDAGGAVSTLDASFTVAAPGPTGDLRVSTKADRSGATALAGARLSGPVYVVATTTSGGPLRGVDFWLDDPSHTSAPRHSEGGAPYDLVGGSDTKALPFDASTLSNGSHSITARLRGASATGFVTASFTVDTATGGDTFTYRRGTLSPIFETEAQGVTIGGSLYEFGGFDGTKSCCTEWNRAQRYDVSTNSWTALPPLPGTGVTHAGFATDGANRIWYAGGYVGDSTGTKQVFGTDEVWRYDVAAGSYTALPKLPQKIAAGQLVYLDGKLHYLGGHTYQRRLDTGWHVVLDLADPAAGWKPAAAMPDPVNHFGYAVLGSRIYVVAGQHMHDGTSKMVTTLQAYDPASDSWELLPGIPVARSHISSTTFALSGRLVVAGGELQSFKETAEVDAYDPATRTWSALTPLLSARRSGVGGALPGGGFAYTGGGSKDIYLATPTT